MLRPVRRLGHLLQVLAVQALLFVKWQMRWRKMAHDVSRPQNNKGHKMRLATPLGAMEPQEGFRVWLAFPALRRRRAPHHRDHCIAGDAPQEQAAVLQLHVLEDVVHREDRALRHQRRRIPHLEAAAVQAHRLAGHLGGLQPWHAWAG